MSELTDLIDSALLKRERESKAREYLGGSRWGEKCPRMLGFEFHQAPTDEEDRFPAPILRIFEMGHDSEERMASHLRLAGFTLLTHDEDGKQFGFVALDGKLAGHCDGIITAGPLDLPYPLVWENKAVGNTIWRSVVREGLETGKPVYFGQIQTYCAYITGPEGIQLNGGLFTMIHRETGEIYDEHVPFSTSKAQELSDKAVIVALSDKPEELPRISNRPDWWECEFCDYRMRCHGVTPIQPSAKADTTKFPAWLTTKA